MKRSTFEELYENPFRIDEFRLDDIEDIYFYYRQKMKSASNRQELINQARKFKFFTASVVKLIDKATEEEIVLLLSFFRDKGNKGEEVRLKNEDLCEIMVPSIMLHAHLISTDFELPEYYAALQYIRAFYKFEEE